MEFKEKKSITHYTRALHRDVGFFVVGLTIVYCISGFVLTFRNTDFLKSEVLVQRELDPDLEDSALGQVLRIREFKVEKTEGDIVYFNNGTYNKVTGIASFKTMELPWLLKEFNSLHKTSSRNIIHWFTVIYAVLLLFLAISSFFMYKKRTSNFRRGIYIATVGFIAAAVLLAL